MSALCDVTAIPLAEMYLCAEMSCKRVTTDSRRCPVCGSQVISLAAILDRVEEPEGDHA